LEENRVLLHRLPSLCCIHLEFVFTRRLFSHQVFDEVVPPAPNHVRLTAKAVAPVW